MAVWRQLRGNPLPQLLRCFIPPPKPVTPISVKRRFCSSPGIEQIGSESRDWNEHEEFFRYTAGRFLFDEAYQLSCRYVRFDMSALARIASRSIGSSACVDIEKLSEGQYNKTFLLTMANNTKVIAKVPNPNAGLPHYTTASEVATTDFVRNTLKVPAPKIFAWSSKANENPVGAEYIIMENIVGVPLSQKWQGMSGEDKQQLIEAVIDIETAFASSTFKMFGSLYYKEDLKPSNPTPCSVEYIGGDDEDVVSGRFVVGPSTDRKAFDDWRGTVSFDRGPWITAEQYITAIARREIACIQGLDKFPRPAGVFNGPGCYRPDPLYKISVLREFLASVYLAPLFLQARPPAFLDFQGPKWVGFDAPTLPDNFDNLSALEQQRAKTLLSEQSLSKLYEVQSSLKCNKVYRAMRHQESLGCQIISLVGNILQDGEPLLKGQLMQLEREWFNIPSVGGRDGPPCPLKYSSDDSMAQKLEQSKWLQGVLLTKELLSALGDVETGWQGWVEHEDYNTLKENLETLREQFLDQLPNSEEERAQWIAAWPFQS